MTVREAILQAIPIFVAQPNRDVYALRLDLEDAGIPSNLAVEIVEFLPIAAARAMLDGMGITFTDHYIRQTSQGHVIGQKLLADEPVYREGLAMAEEIMRMGQEKFMAVAGMSREFRNVNKALNSGASADTLRCAPPVVLAHGDDDRTFDDTSGGVQRKDKTWWQFWKK